MTTRDSDELNRKVRGVLKKLNVAWKDGGEMLRTSNEIVGFYEYAIHETKDINHSIIEAVKELVND